MEILVLEFCFRSGHKFYINQITNYDWVDEKFINVATQRLLNIIPLNGEYLKLIIPLK